MLGRRQPLAPGGMTESSHSFGDLHLLPPAFVKVVERYLPRSLYV